MECSNKEYEEHLRGLSNKEFFQKACGVAHDIAHGNLEIKEALYRINLAQSKRLEDAAFFISKMNKCFGTLDMEATYTIRNTFAYVLRLEYDLRHKDDCTFPNMDEVISKIKADDR